MSSANYAKRKKSNQASVRIKSSCVYFNLILNFKELLERGMFGEEGGDEGCGLQPI